MQDWIVEIADEEDGFIIVEARDAEEAETIARNMGYNVLWAHEEE